MQANSIEIKPFCIRDRAGNRLNKFVLVAITRATCFVRGRYTRALRVYSVAVFYHGYVCMPIRT